MKEVKILPEELELLKRVLRVSIEQFPYEEKQTLLKKLDDLKM